MGADKGHCAEGIRTGSLSSIPLEKKQQVKRQIKRQKGEEGERRATEGNQKVRAQKIFHFVPFLPLPFHLIFQLSINYSALLLKQCRVLLSGSNK